MTHLPFILAAYLAAALVIGGMIGWVVLDLRRQKRRLDRLEKQGAIRPRSPG